MEHRPRRLPRRPGDRRSISTPAPPAAGPSAPAPLSPPASTSISKSRSPRPSKTRCRLARAAERAGRKGGVVQDKLFLPGLKKLRKLYEAEFFGRVSVGAARFRLVGVRRRADPGAAAELELPQGDRRRADPRYVRALALHLRPALGADHRGLVPPHDGAAKRRDESRPALRRRCRGPRLRDLRARRRRPGADRLVLGEPGQARRPVADPGRRHAGLGGRRAAPLLHPAGGRDAAAVLQPGSGRRRWCSTSSGRKCPRSSRSRTAIAPAGNCSCATSPRTRRSRRRSSKAPRACSSPKPATRATASGAGSICRNCALIRQRIGQGIVYGAERIPCSPVDPGFYNRYLGPLLRALRDGSRRAAGDITAAGYSKLRAGSR